MNRELYKRLKRIFGFNVTVLTILVFCGCSHNNSPIKATVESKTSVQNHPTKNGKFYTKPPHTIFRTSYRRLSKDDVNSMLKKYNLFDSSRNKNGDFQNDYELIKIDGDKVVIDHATGLMWHRSGSKMSDMTWDKVNQWVREFNEKGYAGFNDWRLPTIEEAASLLESSKMNGKLYIDPVFKKGASWLWTGDYLDSDFRWIVILYFGTVHWNYSGRYLNVKPVRSNIK